MPLLQERATVPAGPPHFSLDFTVPVFVDVALNLPLEGTFTYGVPPALVAHAQRGYRVLVPFRNKILVGLVVRQHSERPHLKRIRNLSDVLDRERFLPEELLALTEWIARYYHAPLGESVHLAVTSVLAPPKGEAQWALRDDAPQDFAAFADLPFAEEVRTLLQKEAMSHAHLRAALPDLRTTDLDALEEAGLIHLQHGGGSRKPRTDLVVQRTDKTPEQRIGDKQQLVLDFLAQYDEAWLSELRDLYQTSRQTIYSLAKRQLVTYKEVEVEYDPFGHTAVARRKTDPALTPTQANAVKQIQDALTAEQNTTFLLHGVTGSGKTEVYIRAIRHVRKLGKRALILLPEIALTPQFIGVLRACLHEELAVVHSQLTPAQRRSQWRRIRSGHIGVIIGARSSLFAPIENLGLILVDEEHDPSFKQHEGVRYNARDAALVLAQSHNAVTVLGTATPSLESLHNARTGRFALLEMPERVGQRPMPDIELIDLRHHDHTSVEQHGIHISEPLASALRTTVDAGNQAILFLNRRGFSPELRCTSCGESVACVDCERPMTYHRRGNVMMCHACGRSAVSPRACPSCGADALERMGAGTERLEHSLASALEGMRVGRLDRDISRARAMEKVLSDFRKGELDVLVGTQMVTKGHDFPKVTLVGVLAGDQSLSFADFRSGERTYQLLTQVAGRAGRADQPGRVLIQTWKPDHPVMQAVLRGDYPFMAHFELRGRQRAHLPPYGHVVLLRLSCPDATDLMHAAERIHSWLTHQTPPEVHVGPPVEAPIPKVRDKFRMQILFQCQHRKPLHLSIPRLKQFLSDDAELLKYKGLLWSIDVDPQQLN